MRTKNVKVLFTVFCLSITFISFQNCSDMESLNQNSEEPMAYSPLEKVDNNSNNTPKFVANELLIGPKMGTSSEDMKSIIESHGAKLKRVIRGIQVHQVVVPEQALEAVSLALSKNPKIEFVQKNIEGHMAQIPNDAKYSYQWHHPLMEAPQAWDITTGSANVPIAVLDSGFDPSNQDIGPKLLPGYNSAGNNSNYQANNSICDNASHGTAVASTAAGKANDSYGTAGVAWQNPIIPVLIFNSSCGLNEADAAEGIVWAADNGARVINMSWIFYWSPPPQTLINAVNYALNKGVVLVAAAGNDNTDKFNGIYPAYPQSLPGVITVAATDRYDVRTSWSNFGDYVSVSAPGLDVYTSGVGGALWKCYGTSFSSPIVAGVVALMLSANNDLSRAQVKDLLEQTSEDKGNAGWDQYYGYGRVNAQRAVAAASMAVPNPDPINGKCGTANGQTFSSEPTENLCLTGSASAVSLSGSNYSWTCKGQYGGVDASCSANYKVVDNEAPTAPTNLKGAVSVQVKGKGRKARTSYSVDLSWSAATDNVGVVSYNVYRNGSLIGSTSSLSFSDKTVTGGVSYTFTVRAVDGSGNLSLESNAVTLTP